MRLQPVRCSFGTTRPDMYPNRCTRPSMDPRRAFRQVERQRCICRSCTHWSRGTRPPALRSMSHQGCGWRDRLRCHCSDREECTNCSHYSHRSPQLACCISPDTREVRRILSRPTRMRRGPRRSASETTGRNGSHRGTGTASATLRFPRPAGLRGKTRTLRDDRTPWRCSLSWVAPRVHLARPKGRVPRARPVRSAATPFIEAEVRVETVSEGLAHASTSITLDVNRPGFSGGSFS